jgi:hypothetical protein
MEVAVSDKMLRSLPENLTDRNRILHRVDGTVRNDPVSADVALLPTERALPIRRFFSWPGKRNYEGSWWSSTVRTHLLFESLLEREYLLAADFDARVVGIAAQPVALLWPHDISGHKHHVPDYFVRLQNGDGRLVDVRHPKHIEKSAAQFAMTRDVCREVGWDYEVFTGLAPTYLANLRWLAGYRMDRCTPSGTTAAAIGEHFTKPLSLRLGVYRASSSTGVPNDVVLANVLHLLWRRQLSTNLQVPLSMDSEVSV